MDKLSRFQRVILASLGNEEFLAKNQRERNTALFEHWKLYHSERLLSFNLINTFRASLSRAYRRLEDRELIHKVRGGWKLTDEGEMMARLEYNFPIDQEFKQEWINDIRRRKKGLL